MISLVGWPRPVIIFFYPQKATYLLLPSVLETLVLFVPLNGHKRKSGLASEMSFTPTT